jgi:hypothetical protein
MHKAGNMQVALQLQHQTRTCNIRRVPLLSNAFGVQSARFRQRHTCCIKCALWFSALLLAGEPTQLVARMPLSNNHSSQHYKHTQTNRMLLCCLQENLHSWMLDKLSRDQFVIKYGDEVVVQWNDGRRFRSEEAYKRTYWTESFVQWCVKARALWGKLGLCVLDRAQGVVVC